MDFSKALAALKLGNAIRRTGWNGSGMFVVVVPECRATSSTLRALGTRDDPNRLARYFARDVDMASPQACALRTAQGTLQVGWVPSQGDLFAEDWETVDFHPDYRTPDQ